MQDDWFFRQIVIKREGASHPYVAGIPRCGAIGFILRAKGRLTRFPGCIIETNRFPCFSFRHIKGIFTLPFLLVDRWKNRFQRYFFFPEKTIYHPIHPQPAYQGKLLVGPVSRRIIVEIIAVGPGIEIGVDRDQRISRSTQLRVEVCRYDALRHHSRGTGMQHECY